MADTARQVVIRTAPAGTGFNVTVQPPVEGELHDREYSTHRQARGYAGGLRLVRGWKIVDLASDAALADMIGGGI